MEAVGAQDVPEHVADGLVIVRHGTAVHLNDGPSNDRDPKRADARAKVEPRQLEVGFVKTAAKKTAGCLVLKGR